jgi:hypothetical protein
MNTFEKGNVEFDMGECTIAFDFGEIFIEG